MSAPTPPRAHVSVTLRVPTDVRSRVEEIATQMGISQSAVWKILIAHYVRPALQDGLVPGSLLPAPPAATAPRPVPPRAEDETRRVHIRH